MTKPIVFGFNKKTIRYPFRWFWVKTVTFSTNGADLPVEKDLDDLDVCDVFARCLDANKIPEDQRSELILANREIVESVSQEDRMAE